MKTKFTITDILLYKMSGLYTCRKEDFLLFLRSRYSGPSSASVVYKKLINNNYISEKSIRLRKSSSPKPTVNYTRVTLTPVGVNYLIDTFPFDYKEIQHRYDEAKKNFERYTHNNNLYSYFKCCSSLLMFESIGVKGIDFHKPSLKDLYSQDDTNNTYLPYSQVTDEQLQKGFFYTSLEVRDFMIKNENLPECKRFLEGETSLKIFADTIAYSRFVGIYISSHSLFLVYTPLPTKNRLIKSSKTTEDRLLTYLTSIFHKTFTPIKFSGRDVSTGCIVFPDSYKYAYTLAVGAPNGRIRRGVIPISVNVSPVYNYNNFAVFPQTDKGVQDLDYFINRYLALSPKRDFTTTHYFEDCIDLIRDFKLTLPEETYFISNNTCFANFIRLGYLNDSTCIYVPFLDLHTLYSLRQYSNDLRKDGPDQSFTFIIKDPNLADVISHCLRIPNLTFISLSGDIIPCKTYDKDGFEVGIKRPTYRHSEFNGKNITITIGEELLAKLDKYAEDDNITRSKAVRKILASQLK